MARFPPGAQLVRETADRLRKLYAPDERREEPEGLAESGERLLDADSDRIGDCSEPVGKRVAFGVLFRKYMYFGRCMG
ncbi:hypothetical protein KC357_g105 [Hortaea werneckii]|nr:hypothetical protein KC357_g105 [Hortaea werneckii]